MANNSSSKKRIKTNERNRLRNKAYKSTIKTIYKKCILAIENLDSKDTASVSKLISIAYSKIDKAVQKGILHSNTGSSKKASLSRYFKSACLK